jgi:hypothetical protein
MAANHLLFFGMSLPVIILCLLEAAAYCRGNAIQVQKIKRVNRLRQLRNWFGKEKRRWP